MVKKEERKVSVSESDDKLEGKQLYLEIGKYATRAGREAIVTKDAFKMAQLSTAMGLLNQAQGLVKVDSGKARRILTLAMRLI